MHPGNRLELRLEEKEGTDREARFREAKEALERFLAAQGVSHVAVTLSEDRPCQNPNSGKFKHIINLQKKENI